MTGKAVKQYYIITNSFYLFFGRNVLKQRMSRFLRAAKQYDNMIQQLYTRTLPLIQLYNMLVENYQSIEKLYQKSVLNQLLQPVGTKACHGHLHVGTQFLICRSCRNVTARVA